MTMADTWKQLADLRAEQLAIQQRIRAALERQDAAAPQPVRDPRHGRRDRRLIPGSTRE
jgi:hypothetical protein